METAVKYRSDVDGLRGIAVLLVVFYHTGLGWLPGGFVGVDVFFVISGFLITGIIYDEMQQRRFKFSNFYLRRIKRILPAFYSVSIITVIAGYFFLLPDDYSGFSSSLQAALYFYSNVYFWRNSTGYFTFNAEEMPLLHAWSLSVEEQFYLLWPLILLVVFIFRRSRFFLPLLVALVIFGFSFSQFEALSKPRSAYYLLTYRAGELLLGAVLALWIERRYRISPWASQFLGVLGLVLIFFSALWLDRTSVFPGFTALIPCLGAALVILAGADRDSSSFKLLSFAPLIGIGLVSYSLYLWHWPVFAFVRYLQYEITAVVGLAVTAISLVLSILSWKFIEQPLRRKKVSFSMAFSVYFVVPALALFTLTEGILKTDGLIWRFGDTERVLYQRHLESNQFVSQANGWCHIGADGNGNLNQQFDELMLKCIVGERSNPDRAKGLLWGDSHAAHFAPFLDVIGKNRNIEFRVVTSAGCASILSTEKDLGENPDVCRSFRTFVRENASSFDVAYVASRWDLVGKSPVHFVGVAESLAYLSEKVERVVVMSQIPLFRNERSTSYELRKKLIPAVSDQELTKVYDINPTYLESNKVVADISSNLTNVSLLDLTSFFCDAQGCSQNLNGVHAYYDKSHLNIVGAQRLAISFLETDREIQVAAGRYIGLVENRFDAHKTD